MKLNLKSAVFLCTVAAPMCLGLAQNAFSMVNEALCRAVSRQLDAMAPFDIDTETDEIKIAFTGSECKAKNGGVYLQNFYTLDDSDLVQKAKDLYPDFAQDVKGDLANDLCKDFSQKVLLDYLSFEFVFKDQQGKSIRQNQMSLSQ